MPGGIELRADGLVAAAYRHRMSRAGQPQLHMHVVAANLVRGSDGRWSALHGYPIFQHAKAAGSLYQAPDRWLALKRARGALVVHDGDPQAAHEAAMAAWRADVGEVGIDQAIMIVRENETRPQRRGQGSRNAPRAATR